MAEDEISRRDFVKVTVGALVGGIVGAAIGSAGMRAALPPTIVTKTKTETETKTKTETKMETKTVEVKPWLPEKWDEEHEVIIVGTGFAGLAAAIEAHNAGAEVLVIEKTPAPGGNSAINGGCFAAAGSDRQKELGIKDSPELMYKDMLKAGLGLNYPELAMTVAEKSWETFKWTMEYLGVEYCPTLVHLGGHSVARSFVTKVGTGWGIVSKELDKCKELGIPIRTECKLTRIIREKPKSGRVLGIEVEEKGKTKYLRAKKAVVLATGGFAADVKYRMTQDPRLTEKIPTTNKPTATADGLLPALAAGANPVQLSWIQLGPWASPDEPGLGGCVYFVVSTRPYGFHVDPATGRRFVNELGSRKEIADALFAVGHVCIHITDEYGFTKIPSGWMKFVEERLKDGAIRKFDTIEELASFYKINLDGLKAELERYNSLVKKGIDEDFGKPIPKDAKPLKPPFYADRLWPKVHHCMGGVQINKKAQVIDTQGNVIPGLYAAGEAAGGVHGACRLGSCATADCLVFGRIAGKNAAAETPC